MTNRKNKPKAEFEVWTGPGDEEQRWQHGEHVLVTHVMGRINIIHTDRPSEETIRKRIDEVVHEEIDGDPFDDNCPACQDFKNYPYNVVYGGERDRLT